MNIVRVENGLYRHSYTSVNCKYCAKAENRFQGTNGTVARIMFDVVTPIEWREHYSKDKSICIILESKTVDFKPEWQSIPSEDYLKGVYCSLILKDGVSYREWVLPDLNSKILQIVVPKHKIEEILIDKTLEKIIKRFYWAT